MWECAYRQAFPTLVTMQSVRNDGWAQRGGIDRVLILASGQTLTVDEKIRRKAYHDVLFEYLHRHDNGRRENGWIAKDLACNYIAYGWQTLGYAYLFPFQQLRRAWRDNRHEWVRDHFKSEARNRSYVSIGVCVPIHIVLDAITDAMRVTLKSAEPA